MSSHEDAAQITRKSKSNLALAFFSLSRERRRDMETFYAFCRVVDDIADSPKHSRLEKERRLDLWREALSQPFSGEPKLALLVRELIGKYSIPKIYFEEILTGVTSDLSPHHYADFDELREYCYRVASAVGLVSIEIFGYRDSATKEYAVDLGIALQLTNIIRDVGEDFANDRRIYLPREELAQFNYTPADLAARCHDERFLKLMNFQADRAESFYRKAIAGLPRKDHHAMLPAEIMREVYHRLLLKIRDDNFQVFEKKYRLSKLDKMTAILSAMMCTYF